jgi:hypothetical protein
MLYHIMPHSRKSANRKGLLQKNFVPLILPQDSTTTWSMAEVSANMYSKALQKGAEQAIR